jgi:chorismate synthase
LALIEGLPAGLVLDAEWINAELRRRQGGFGRSGRQALEQDQAIIKAGVRRGLTIGSPVVIELVNRDQRLDQAPPLTRPRPGHADFAGGMKWLTADCRPVLERASARETAARVAAGAVARCLLRALRIEVLGYVQQIGRAAAQIEPGLDFAEVRRRRDQSEVYCPDAQASAAMMAHIQQAAREGDTLGGIVEVIAQGQPPGLGSCARWQDRLDGCLMQAVGAIQAIKGVEIGAGFAAASLPGSAVHDQMDYDGSRRSTATFGFSRRSNNAGGLEGGMTNGEPLVLRAAMKPISTLRRGLDTVDLETKAAVQSAYERSDVCAVPACSVIAENVVGFELARACLQKFGGDTLAEVVGSFERYLELARAIGGG